MKPLLIILVFVKTVNFKFMILNFQKKKKKLSKKNFDKKKILIKKNFDKKKINKKYFLPVFLMKPLLIILVFVKTVMFQIYEFKF